VSRDPQTTVPSSAHELELDGDAFRALVDAAVERLAPYLDALPSAPASWPQVPAPAPRKLPRTGDSTARVLDDLFARLPAGINTAAPGFMGYIPGGGLPHAAVADLVAGVVNRYVGISSPAPLLAAVESEVIAWFASLIGYPATASGTFTSGGSAANLIAIAGAREERFGARGDELPDPRRGVVYVSDQAHHSVMKGARYAGLHAAQIRVLESDAGFRMPPAAVRAAIARDRARGLEPFLIVASAGTTNTGAVDPLDALADVAADERVRLHVDAAYGGFFLLTARGQQALAGIERADSVALDPHKTLFLPYGTGALLLRDPHIHARAFSLAADYLPAPGDAGPPEAADLGFELTRPFRALRVWLPLRLHGADAFARLLDEKLDLARMLERELRTADDLEMVAGAQLSTLAFAVRGRAGEDAAGMDARTAALLEHINAGREVLVTGTRVRGRLVIRPSIVSFRTHEASVRALIERVRATAAW
jgi:aromatic-L-amino-acid/L-tryptophan decarboxylase